MKDGQLHMAFFKDGQLHMASFKDDQLHKASFKDGQLHMASFKDGQLHVASFKDGQLHMASFGQGRHLQCVSRLWLSEFSYNASSVRYGVIVYKYRPVSQWIIIKMGSKQRALKK
jgi:hypothetical protein